MNSGFLSGCILMVTNIKEIADEAWIKDRNSKKQDIFYPSEINADIKRLHKIVLVVIF